MEGLLALWLLDVMLVSAISAYEKAKRKKIIRKWAKGELTMKELLWLKRQPWFQKAFKPIEIDLAKKES